MKTWLFAVVLMSLVGCTGMQKGIGMRAAEGDVEPLLAGIRSGAIRPDDYVEQFTLALLGDEPETFTILPICTVAGVIAEPQLSAVRALLDRGARVDLPCSKKPGSQYPLDSVMGAYAVLKHNGVAQRMLSLAIDQADAFIALGAKSIRGPVHTREDFIALATVQQNEFATVVKQIEERKAAEEAAEARKRERERARNDGSTLSGLATIAGIAAGNYAGIQAQRRAEAAAATLPIARVDSFPQPGTSQGRQAGRTEAVRPTTPVPAVPPRTQANGSLNSNQVGQAGPAAQVRQQERANAGPQVGTLYVMVGVQLTHTKPTTPEKYVVAESLVPVQWQYDGSGDRTWHIAKEARSDVVAAYRKHIETTHPACDSSRQSGPDGCWAVLYDTDYALTADEARAKHASFMERRAGLVRDRSFAYQTRVVWRD